VNRRGCADLPDESRGLVMATRTNLAHLPFWGPRHGARPNATQFASLTAACGTGGVCSAEDVGLRWAEPAGLKGEHLYLLRRQLRTVGTLEEFGGPNPPVVAKTGTPTFEGAGPFRAMSQQPGPAFAPAPANRAKEPDQPDQSYQRT